MKELDLMSPSRVAEKYGGDKRRIAQAAQMGLVDPTVAVMAGMFIDRMRSAAVKEQTPQTTVAQDVMAAPSGGVASLPVPEEMFGGEQGFAGGGIVAFEDGGQVRHYQNTGYVNPYSRYTGMADPRSNILQFTQEEEEEQKRLKDAGLLDALGYMKSKFVDPVAAYFASDPARRAVTGEKAPSKAPSAPAAMEPYPDETERGTAKGILAGDLRAKEFIPPEEAPKPKEEQTSTTEPSLKRPSIAPASYEEALGKAKSAMGALPKEDIFADIKEELKNRKGRADEDLKQSAWMRLAEAGFSMASGTSPYAMQNIAKAGVQAIKGYGEDLKDQKKLDREDRKMLSDIQKLERAEAREDVFKTTELAYKILNEANEDVRTRLQTDTQLAIEGSRAARDRETNQLTKGLTLANAAEQQVRANLTRRAENITSDVATALKANPNYIEEQAAAARNRVLKDFGLSLPSMDTGAGAAPDMSGWGQLRVR